MNPRVLANILSRLCQFMAVALCVPAAVGLAYEETAAWQAYLITAAMSAAASIVLRLLARSPTGTPERITRREGFVAVVLSWAAMVTLGALPYWISGGIPVLADAIFESASGYTTTGATILTNIEALGRAHLFQRDLAHWVGGMGIIVLSVAILPDLAVGGMQLFSAESSGIATEKLAPRIVSTARRLWWIYAGMTGVLIALLLLGGMSLYDAVTHAFGTLATGGFSPHNTSIGAFDSVYIEIVITVFMLLSAMSFALHYRVAARLSLRPLLGSLEVQVFLAVFVVFAAAITVSLVTSGTYNSVGSALRAGSFQTASILTTTGFGTADFDKWPDFCRYMLVLTMFLGGCAGSTAGGVKVVRLIVVYKHATVELRKLIHPSLVHPVMLGDTQISQATIQAILGFFLLYIITTATATMLVLAMGVDLVTGVTAVVSAMNSIGPGLGVVGPAGHYGTLPDASKWVLSACMIVGRLEIYTVFVLFTPSFWRR
jgi:trk system potassium uptake protein TrkH